jgi:predicted DNA-binding antitoxin AbrB/MazE fold protein
MPGAAVALLPSLHARFRRYPAWFPCPKSYNEGAMARQLDAVYECGVLRPLEPLDLRENQRVRLIVEEQIPTVPAKEEVNERKEELAWLATQAQPYAGQWVALSGSRLVANGTKLREVRAAARAAGIEDPLFAHVPGDAELPFGGW